MVPAPVAEPIAGTMTETLSVRTLPPLMVTLVLSDWMAVPDPDLIPASELRGPSFEPRSKPARLVLSMRMGPLMMGARGGAGDVEIGGEGSALEARAGRQMDADGGKEGFELVDRGALRGDFEIECGGGAAGLVGACGVDDCFADGDGCVLQLAGEGLEVLRRR